MRNHLFSFIKCPIGYVFNFLAHFSYMDKEFPCRFVCWGCETFCLKDGIQDECWF